MIHPTAAANWTLGGSFLTWTIPLGVLIVAGAVLYLQFSRPHRIPGHSELVPARTAPPDPGTAHAMAAAAGMTTAAGAGADPLATEPEGAKELVAAAEEDRPAEVHLPGAAGQEEPGSTGADHDPAAPEAGE